MKQITSAVIDDDLLDALHRYDPERQKDMWKNSNGNPRKFKDDLTLQLLFHQSRRCAYCGIRLREKSPARDHIAPKESHPEFTFIPANLVLACFFCNSECKGTEDTVALKNAVYENCSFTIIHPIFDKPSDHIHFVNGNTKLLIKVVPGSLKGRETVKMFRLADAEIAKQRAKDAKDDDDLEHLPGKWRAAFDQAVIAKLKLKYRIG